VGLEPDDIEGLLPLTSGPSGLKPKSLELRRKIQARELVTACRGPAPLQIV
jgi:hypothetical protein